MNIDESPTKSWCLFDSASFSNIWENNFEEIDFVELNSSSSSYELIEELQNECKILDLSHGSRQLSAHKLEELADRSLKSIPIFSTEDLSRQPSDHKLIDSESTESPSKQSVEKSENPLEANSSDQKLVSSESSQMNMKEFPEINEWHKPLQSSIQKREETRERTKKEKKKKDCFSEHIETTASDLLNSVKKQEEIKAFENLSGKFEKWLAEKADQKTLEEDCLDKDLLSCKFLIHNNNIDTFVLEFSDVYVNIVVKKQAHKNRIQSLFAKFLKEVEPKGITKEKNIDNQKNKSKIIFQFAKGTTKFIITAGFDFRLRLNHYIKLCSSIDQRFVSMGAFLSYWANQRKIFSEQFLNPYALYFMLIYFLMTRNPSILPRFGEEDIQKMDFPKTMFSSSKKQGNLVTYQEQGILLPNAQQTEKLLKTDDAFKQTSESSLRELITQFFYTFAFEIPKLKRTISVKSCSPSYGKSVQGYSVEDPFNSNYDLCKDLNNNKHKPFQLVNSEFVRAYNLIIQGKTQEVCQERKI